MSLESPYIILLFSSYSQAIASNPIQDFSSISTGKSTFSMHCSKFPLWLVLMLCVTVFTLPTPPTSSETFSRRANISTPLGVGIDTGDDIGDLAQFSPIEDGFLEGDSDSGGSDKGTTGVSVANGATGGGSGSASNSESSSGSTSSFCSKSTSNVLGTRVNDTTQASLAVPRRRSRPMAIVPRQIPRAAR